MLDKCANSACAEQFKFLGQGRLFLKEPNSVLCMSREEIMTKCYWLCENCCKTYRVEFTTEGFRLLETVPAKVCALKSAAAEDAA